MVLSLAEIYDSLWNKLAQAVRLRQESWHLGSLATVREGSPEVRTLVLRGVSEPDRLVWMHTDLRSPKCIDIQKKGEGALLFYDPKDCRQLRLNGVLSLDPKSKDTENAWEHISSYGRRCYQGSLSPGSSSQELEFNLPSEPVASDLGRENFSRLLFQVTKIDWLFLKSTGHVRAQWTLGPQGFQGEWVAP